MFEFITKHFVRRQMQTRNYFSAASNSRLLDWVVSYSKINLALKQDYIKFVLKARQFSDDNEIVTGILKNCRRNVCGPHGFKLQSKSANGKQIESEWRMYNSRAGHYLTFDECQSGRDFDSMILRTFLVDGEVFIHRSFDPASPFGFRYEIVDSLSIDPFYNEEFRDGSRIVMGVELDPRGRETAFWLRQNRNSDQYFTGERIRVPASDMIHIFRKNHPEQARGYSELAPILLKIAHLTAYEEAEIVHARAQSCTMGIWEKTGNAGDLFDKTNASGEVASTLEPGSFKFAPEGYKASFLQNSSPSSNFGIFWKNILRTISNSFGLSYNKASGDYESVNYSSLREASLEDRATYEDMQIFLIENWKDVEFLDFISYGVKTGRYSLKNDPSLFDHVFFGRRFQWVDPVKEISALEKEMALGLSDPITEIERRGLDPDEVLDRLAKWRDMCAARGIVLSPAQSFNLLADPAANEPDNNSKGDNSNAD